MSNFIPDISARHKPGVVVDKSYLHRFAVADAKELAANYTLLTTEALLYEVSKDAVNRNRLFKNLTKLDTLSRYLEHYSVCTDFEMERLVPAPSPVLFSRLRDYRALDEWAAGRYSYPEHLDKAIVSRRLLIERTADSFIAAARAFRREHPTAFSGSNRSSEAERQRLKADIAGNPSVVRAFLAKVAEGDSGERRRRLGEISEKMDEKWAHYRMSQVMMLLSLSIASRFRLDVPLQPTVLESIQHDVLDSQYLVSALLAGAIATRDKRIRGWWGLLMPNAPLFG